MKMRRVGEVSRASVTNRCHLFTNVTTSIRIPIEEIAEHGLHGI